MPNLTHPHIAKHRVKEYVKASGESRPQKGDHTHQEDDTNNSPLYLIPRRSRLVRLYPNPFNEKVTISYQVSRHEKVAITIYNLLGEKVETLIDDEKHIGVYTIDWSGISAATGAYYCVMKTDESLDIRKMVLLK